MHATDVRWYRRGAAAIVVGTALLAAACASSGKSTSASGTPATAGGAASLLGTKHAASGTPIKIGTVGDGKTPSIDNTSQVTIAKAMVKYFNEYRGGIAGRPVELVSCETQGDEAKSTDCATEMIRNNVVMVVLPAISTLATVWRPLHDAGVPTFMYAPTDHTILGDTKTSFAIGGPTNVLINMPVAVAKKGNAKKVVGVIIDVPAATEIYKTRAKDLMKAQGLDFELMAIPPGQADMTPQMAQIAKQKDVAVQLVGNDSFDIAALKGLQATGFKGPIACIGCDADSVRTALGGYLEGITVATQGAAVGGDNTDVNRYHAIVAAYASGLTDIDNQTAQFAYITWAAMRDALDKATGEVTAASVISTIRAMPNMPLALFGGAKLRCNGKADPVYASVCAKGSVVGTLDKTGHPANVQVTDSSDIPG
jgi:branched-chain amino acid transport system substrate-binding protein